MTAVHRVALAAATTLVLVLTSCAAPPAQSTQATRWVQTFAGDAQNVKRVVDKVAVAVHWADAQPGNVYHLNNLQLVAELALPVLVAPKSVYALTDTSGKVGDAVLATYSAVAHLHGSIQAMLDRIDNPNPEFPAFSRAVAEWDGAIRTIWAAAGILTPPPTI